MSTQSLVIMPDLVLSKEKVHELGGRTTFESKKANGSFHIADYSGRIKISNRIWEIKVREEIVKLYDVTKDPRSYTVWGTAQNDIRCKFMISFEENEVVKLYHDMITHDIWAMRVNTATRIFCEESASITFE